ncbi:shikimate dehydrogenase [Candidatus Peregrinibacteria bacterium]|nr:MAG: shikimate dehydrogenase [Candidatus Peregrinibacteria bacterium]
MNTTFGIVGHPVTHSLSPVMHNAAIQHLGLDADYQLFDIDPQDPEALANFTYETDLNHIGGFSVTMPYKEVMMDYMDYYDPLAKAIGALNTVVNRNSELIGYNTDATGALAALKEKTELPGKKALVLGAGGAARAIAYVLRESGAEVFLYNRTEAKGQALCQALDIEWIELASIGQAAFDLIINTTPVGSHAESAESGASHSIITAEAIAPHAVVMDIITQPLETPFIHEAKKAGAIAITGERMLLHQAIGQFELWFPHAKAPVQIMEEALYAALSSTSSID